MQSKLRPLVYYDGSQWKNWECYNNQQNNVAILVGGGPSLNRLDISNLTGPGKTVFGLNTTYPTVRPDIWIGMDDPKCYDRKVFYEPFPKILRGNYWDKECEGVSLLKLPACYFARVKKVEHKGDIFYKIDDNTENFIWDKNVFVTAINLILYMGFRKIYLAGVDFSIDEGDYHHSSIVLSDNNKLWNKHLYKHLYRYTDWLYSTGKMCGIDIHSISPGSRINEIVPYTSLEELNSSLKLPKTDKLYHCAELEDEELISKEYKKLLEYEHQSSTWGIMAGKMISELEAFLTKNSATEVLDYGAGSSSFRKALTIENIKVYEYDPGVSAISSTPEPRDFVVCIDVLEHIEPDLIENVLEDLSRVTKVQGYFTIAMYPAQRKLKDGRNAHLIIEDSGWWVAKLCKYFNIVNFSEKDKQLNIEVSTKAPSKK